MIGVIPADAVAGVTAVVLIIIAWLIRDVVRLRERVSRLEGIVNHRREEK